MLLRRNVYARRAFIIGIFALVCTALVISTRAATPAAGVEAESGTMSGASIVSSTRASGGSAVKFGSGSSATNGCPAYPAFPDTNCTGWQHTGVTLTAYTGPTTITTAGTVIDGKDIGCLSVSANNVTIKKSRVRCAGGPESSTTYGINLGSVSGFVLEDTEVMSTTIPSSCTSGDPSLLTRPLFSPNTTNARLTRVYFHNTRSGIGVGDGMTVEDSVLLTDCNPDPHGTGADWQHSTAINSSGGAQNVTIRHNVLDNGAENASSAMSFYPENGPNDNFLITQNLINTRAYYCAYFGYTPPGEEPNTRFAVTNNVWGTKYNTSCGMNSPVYYANFSLILFNTAYPTGWGGSWSGNTWQNGIPYTLSDL